MFKCSNNRQFDIFKDISGVLSKGKQKRFDSATSWHNVFYQDIVSKIDEAPFSVLYDMRMGRPNAPVRVLIGMMILKEGNGWSDAQLFDECRYNLMIMRALGLANIDEDVPVASTYYEFRKLIGIFKDEKGKDLIEETFQQITSEQVSTYEVSGKKIRLDSKLINSNIAKSNRLNLIVEAVRKYLQEIEIEGIPKTIEESGYKLLVELKGKSAVNITYPLNASEKKDLLKDLGLIIYQLLDKGSGGKNYDLLKRVYNDQYEELTEEQEEGDDDNDTGNEKEEKLILIKVKDGKDISSSSVQSVHDPEATYRSKGEGASRQTVSGYHVNITESCGGEEGEINLILDVKTKAANICEDEFLLESINECKKVLEKGNIDSKIKEAITDGGFDSIKNRKEMLSEDQPIWRIPKMKGGKHVFIISKTDTGEIEVYDKKTVQRLEVHFSERANKYVIKNIDGTKRYMTIEVIENYLNHQTILSQIDEESYNLRASVESTIHQTFHRVKKGNKIMYRGLLKCHWYALLRAFWVNIVRITDKKVQKSIFLLILLFTPFTGHYITRKFKNTNIL